MGILGVVVGIGTVLYSDRLKVEHDTAALSTEIADHGSRISTLELNSATHREIRDLKDTIQDQHKETLEELRNLYQMMGSRRSRIPNGAIPADPIAPAEASPPDLPKGYLRRHVPSSCCASNPYGIKSRYELIVDVVSFVFGQSSPASHGLEYHTARGCAQWARNPN